MSTGNEATYSVRAASRLTGLSPDLLRAWERRYAAVAPMRSAGGTRRYRASDLERLRLLGRAVAAGHRIGDVAGLATEQLAALEAPTAPAEIGPIEAVLDALDRLDATRAEQLIAEQLSARGPTGFARRFALPLLARVGDEWAQERLCIASEHLASSLLRSLLGHALRPSQALPDAPLVVFGTLTNERHELGLLVAAILCLGAGAAPLYLGNDLPAAELLRAASLRRAAALAIGATRTPAAQLAEQLRGLRTELDPGTELWVGGAATRELTPPPGCEVVDDLDRLELLVQRLRVTRG